jgi:large subunit ribosomal protein L18
VPDSALPLEETAQVIDDTKGHTLCAVSSRDKALSGTKGTKIEIAKEVGAALGKAAVTAGVATVVADRAGYLYHGRVKALAEGARENGLEF